MLTRQKAQWRVRQGHKAQEFGDVWESMFRLHCRLYDIAITKMPSGGRWTRGSFVPVKTPFDWILSRKGMGSALIDTKTSAEASLPHSKIEDHQVGELLLHEHQGTPAGYVIWLRKPDEIIFMRASRLDQLMRKRGSISLVTPGAIFLGNSKALDLRRLWARPVADGTIIPHIQFE